MNEKEYADKMQAIYRMIRRKMYVATLAEMLEPGSFALKKAYRLDLNHSWYVLGDVFFKLNDYPMAIKSFRKSAKFCPKDEDALMAMGNTYSEMGRPGLAERLFRKGLVLNPMHMEMRFNLANALFDQKKLALARTEYLIVLNAGGQLAEKARRMVGIVTERMRPKPPQAVRGQRSTRG